MMPGGFGRPVAKSFRGDVQLRSGASLHARIVGSYNGELLDDLLTELGPIQPSDTIIVNFGAWYPAFAWQVCPDRQHMLLSACSGIARGLSSGWSMADHMCPVAA